jgi:hypothetical protein
MQAPDTWEGDEILVEARSIDAVGNRSRNAAGRVTLPAEDEEDDEDEDPSRP